MLISAQLVFFCASASFTIYSLNYEFESITVHQCSHNKQEIMALNNLRDIFEVFYAIFVSFMRGYRKDNLKLFVCIMHSPITNLYEFIPDFHLLNQMQHVVQTMQQQQRSIATIPGGQ